MEKDDRQWSRSVTVLADTRVWFKADSRGSGAGQEKYRSRRYSGLWTDFILKYTRAIRFHPFDFKFDFSRQILRLIKRRLASLSVSPSWFTFYFSPSEIRWTLLLLLFITVVIIAAFSPLPYRTGISSGFRKTLPVWRRRGTRMRRLARLQWNLSVAESLWTPTRFSL